MTLSPFYRRMLAFSAVSLLLASGGSLLAGGFHAHHRARCGNGGA